MKVGITGASGFVGKNIRTYFTSNDVLTHSINLRSKNPFEDFPRDIDAIIHLAGKAHDTSSGGSYDEYYQINTVLTQEIFNFFLQSNVKDFIYFSSVKAVADHTSLILDENVEPNPATFYGKSKREAEKYILSQKIPNGKRVIILRPTMIHGEGNKGNLNFLYQVISKNIPWPLGSFENKRSFLSITNLNYVLLKILNNQQVSSGVYNVADDNSISTNELVKLIAKSANRSVKILKIPVSVMKFFANIGDTCKLPFNNEVLTKLTENYVVSNEKIKRALHIKHLPLSIEQGIFDTVKSFLNK